MTTAKDRNVTREVGTSDAGADSHRRRDPARARSLARLAAVQALYQMDMARTDLNEVIAEFLRHRFACPAQSEAGGGEAGVGEAGVGNAPEGGGEGAAVPSFEAADTGEAEDTGEAADTGFFADLLQGVVARQREIDPLLDGQLKEGWRLHRIDSILRAILRAAAFELLAREDVPVRVVITEYVDVAHAFFEGDEPKVVNGVLDHLARRLRAGELDTPRSM